MFFRVTRSKGNRYLQLLESYRDENGVPRHRLLANIANVSRCSDAEIRKLAESFLRALRLDDFIHKDSLEAGQGYDYGDVLPVLAVWNRLGLGQIIASAVSDRVSIDVAKASLVLVANKVVDPDSKLGAHRWFRHSLFAQAPVFQKGFPVGGEVLLHTLYRSLDYLAEAKDRIEEELYWRLGAYGLGTQLVFYDLTSSYFEGDQAELAAYGYSRDHRPDRPQLVIGVVTSAEGIPFAHYVFEGNRVDKTTVPEVLEDLKRRFRIERCVFVGDRGLVSQVNLGELRKHGFSYIVGLRRRQSRLVRSLLEWVKQNPEAELLDLKAEEVLPPELQGVVEPGTRFVIALNREVQKSSREHRTARLAAFESFLRGKPLEGDLRTVNAAQKAVLRFLRDKRLGRFFEVGIEQEGTRYRLVVAARQDRLREEELLDGRFFLQTELPRRELGAAGVVDAYKGLQQVEQAFRILKNSIELRPIYVRKASRIRGHVMICFLAHLIETLLDRAVREIDPGTSWPMLKAELARVKLVSVKWPSRKGDGQHELFLVTSYSKTAQELYKRLGIRNARRPQSLRFVHNGRSYNSAQQLSLFPTFSIT